MHPLSSSQRTPLHCRAVNCASPGAFTRGVPGPSRLARRIHLFDDQVTVLRRSKPRQILSFGDCRHILVPLDGEGCAAPMGPALVRVYRYLARYEDVVPILASARIIVPISVARTSGR